MAQIVLTICILASFLLPSVFIQTEHETAATDYLVSYFSSQPTSLHNEFANTFVPIQQPLKEKLLAHFPRHDFLIARTYYSHWVPRDGTADILLVIDRLTGKVVAHQWAIWFSGHSESFLSLLEQYPATSKADALSKLNTLAELIATSSPDGNIGTVHYHKREIEIELKLGNDPFRVLRVPLSKNYQFGKLHFINPQSDK